MDVHAHRLAGRRISPPRHSVVNQWDLLARWHRGGDPARDPVEMIEGRPCGRRVERRLEDAGFERARHSS